jgi:uncharacterized protein (UPF0276 family)
MAAVDQEFLKRITAIPMHGFGLSTDVYCPDVSELLVALGDEGSDVDYVELFKANDSALAAVRRRLPSIALAYHGEGLWVTQPDWCEQYPYRVELETAAAHLRTLRSHWMTHECASKQMAGYAFGTYLPPLFTETSAAVTAEHIVRVQQYLDEHCETANGMGPLFLLEMPPLTYFGFGTVPIARFFRLIADRTACGLVLDLGHLWTAYRYSGAWRRSNVGRFAEDFMDVFPVERVVEIHVAGLSAEGEGEATDGATPPCLLDDHAAPIPDMLFDLLAQVLARPDLVHLRGIALEVDNKPIPQTIREYRRFRKEFNRAFDQRSTPSSEHERGATFERQSPAVFCSDTGKTQLLLDYARYVGVVSGASDRLAAESLCLVGDQEGVDRYRRRYLPNEILRWGGDLRDMFPETSRLLDGQGVELEEFVLHWFRTPRPSTAPYDFFLLKIERFVEFVRDRLPSAAPTAEREGEVLRTAYQIANEPMMEGG